MNSLLENFTKRHRLHEAKAKSNILNGGCQHQAKDHGGSIEMMIRPVERLVIIGLGGVSESWLNSWFDRGLFPNLRGILRESASGVLNCSRPSTSAAAWASMLTGHTVSGHGVFDHECVAGRSQGVRSASHTSLLSNHLWQILSDLNHKVISLQVPLTYSMNGVQGLVVGGSDSASRRPVWQGESATVRSLRQLVPDWSHRPVWKQRPSLTEELLARLNAFENRLHDLERLALRSTDLVKDWSVLCVNFQDLDGLLHRMWPEVDYDEQMPQLRPDWLNPIQNSLQQLDLVIGRLADLADRAQAGLMIVSDHGFGPCRSLVNVNGILRVHGIQRGRSLGGRLFNAGARLRDRALRSLHDLWAGPNALPRLRPMQLMIPCDRSKSLAYAPFGRLAGLVYLTEKARGQESKTDRITQEISEILRLIADPDNGQAIFSEVIPVAQRWGIDPVSCGWPEIIALPAEGYHPMARWDYLDKVRLLAQEPGLPGTHRPAGMISMKGAGLSADGPLRADVQDVAPTILKWLGQQGPSPDMAGRIISHNPETSIYQPHIRPISNKFFVDSGGNAQTSHH
ncbi:MAG: hypothetical protein RJA81_1745 [Planctomycetota bacterium]